MTAINEQLAAQLSATEQGLLDGMYLSATPESRIWQEAASVEAQVFIDADYVETEAELAKDYELYLPSTRMLSFVRGLKTVGAVRFIDYDPAIGFKTLDDIAAGKLLVTPEGSDRLRDVDLSTVMEIGTIALQKEYRAASQGGLEAIGDMYGAVYTIGVANNTPNVLASFDSDYYERFGSIFGDALVQLGPAKDYMGSPTIPAIMNVEDAYANLAPRGLGFLADIIAQAKDKITYEPRPNPAPNSEPL